MIIHIQISQIDSLIVQNKNQSVSTFIAVDQSLS